MKTSHLIIAISAAAFLPISLRAQEGDNVRGKLQELEQKARAAKEAGREDEAQAIMEKARRIHAEQDERQAQGGDRMEKMTSKIEELRKAGKPEEAEQLERRIREGSDKKRDGEKGSDERRQHIGEAIKHLRAAGLHEPAERIEQMAREHEKAGTVNGDPRREKAGARTGEIGASEQMQRAVRDMQEQTQRALRETHEQMAKMARAIEELREQVTKSGPK